MVRWVQGVSGVLTVKGVNGLEDYEVLAAQKRAILEKQEAALQFEQIARAFIAIRSGQCSRMDVSAGEFPATVYKAGTVIRVDIKGVF